MIRNNRINELGIFKVYILVNIIEVIYECIKMWYKYLHN